jgi:hypothetical protein
MSSYSQELADEICAVVADDGLSLRAACEKMGLHRRSVRRWLVEHPDFGRGYDIARKVAIDDCVDGMLAIASGVAGSDNNAAVQAAKLEIDTIKWIASKLLPERFGDKVTTEVVGVGGKNLFPERAADPERAAQALLLFLRPLPGGQKAKAGEPADGARGTGAASQGALPEPATAFDILTGRKSHV